MIKRINMVVVACFIVMAIMGAITMYSMIRSLEYARELVVAWISGMSAVTTYLFTKGKK